MGISAPVMHCTLFSSLISRTNTTHLAQRLLAFHGKLIEHLCRKTSKSCEALSKIRHCVDIDTMTNVYYALVHSYLRYGIIAWGNAAPSNLYPLIVLMNKVVRIMCFAPLGRVDIQPMYDCLEILDVQKIFSLETAKLVYKSKNNLLPISTIAKHFEVSTSAEHQHQLRSHRSYQLPPIVFNSMMAKKSLQFREVELWNGIPEEIKTSENLSIFKKRYKSFLLSSDEV